MMRIPLFLVCASKFYTTITIYLLALDRISVFSTCPATILYSVMMYDNTSLHYMNICLISQWLIRFTELILSSPIHLEQM